MLIILTVLSAFINAWLTALVVVGITLWMFCDSDRRAAFWEDDAGARRLLPFAALSIAVPVLYGNLPGLTMGILLVCFLCLILFLNANMTHRLQQRLLELVCLLSVPAAIVAFAQRYLLGVPRSASLFENPNYYAAVIEFVVLIALSRLMSTKSRTDRLYYLSLILLNIAALDTTDCRSAWLALFVGALVLLLLRRHYVAAVGMLVAGMAGLKLALLLPELFPRMSQLVSAANVRGDIWQNAWSAALQHPLFGTGGLSFLQVSDGDYYHAHNLLLDTLMNYGTAGLALLIAFFLPHYRRAWRGLQNPHADRSPFALLFAGTSAVMVHGLTDLTIIWPQSAVLFALLLSCSAFERESESSQVILAPLRQHHML